MPTSLIICKNELLKYKMAKNSCHLYENTLAYNISTHLCELVKFEHDQSTKTEKSDKNIVQPKILLKQTTYLLLEGRKSFPFHCVRSKKVNKQHTPVIRIKPSTEEPFPLIMKQKNGQQAFFQTILDSFSFHFSHIKIHSNFLCSHID